MPKEGITYSKGEWGIRVLANKVAITIDGKNHFLSNSYGNEVANAKLMSLAQRLHETLRDLFAVAESLEEIEHNQFGCDDPECVMCRARTLLAEIDPVQMSASEAESSPAVLPCPFCGQTPDVSNPATFVADQGGKWGHIVCCCAGPEVRTDYKPLEYWKQDAIDAWNKRQS